MDSKLKVLVLYLGANTGMSISFLTNTFDIIFGSFLDDCEVISVPEHVLEEE